jgi:hypothetical protein
MPQRLPAGTGVGGPLNTIVQVPSQGGHIKSLARNTNPRIFFEEFSEFSGAAVVSPVTARTATTAGTPTFAKVANEPNGVYRATLASNSEAETAGFDWGDSLMITKPDAGGTHVNAVSTPVFQAYVRIPTALTTAQTVVIGLATAFNATLTSISKYAWFRFTANMNVTIEGKDGTTTTTGQAPVSGTLTLTANQFYLFSINWTFPEATGFWVDDNYLGSVNLAALASTDKFQPLVAIQKSTGATTPTLDCDWYQTLGWRF